METFSDIPSLVAATGRSLGPSGWLQIDQDRVDTFVRATGEGGGTAVPDGLLTLSLVPYFVARLRRIEDLAMGVNYGIDRARFPAPVRVGDRIRGRTTILTATELEAGSVQLVARTTIEIAGSSKPACVADMVSRLWFRRRSGIGADRSSQYN